MHHEGTKDTKVKAFTFLNFVAFVVRQGISFMFYAVGGSTATFARVGKTLKYRNMR